MTAVVVGGVASVEGGGGSWGVFANGGDHRSTITLSNFRDAAGNPAPDGTQVAVTAAPSGSISGCCYVQSAGGVIIGGAAAPFGGSQYKLFTITNGQIVPQYSAQGVSLASGSQTATVQVVPVTMGGSQISSTAAATRAVQFLGTGTGSVI